MNHKLVNIAGSLPSPIKKIARNLCFLIPNSFRYGKTFLETYKFLQESQWWTRDKLEEYQLQQLEKLLNHAYEHIPYYRKVFDQKGLKTRDIQDFKDLEQLPYLTKDDFKRNSKELISKNIDLRKARVITTSGTTGKPLQFYTNGIIDEMEWAFFFHQWARIGYQLDDRRAELSGPIIETDDSILFEPISRVIRLSPRISDLGTVKHYLKMIEKYNSNFLHGYPGAISNFAFMIKKHDLEIPFQLKAVLFASEVVYDWQRDIVSDVFNCRVFSIYGLTEKVVLAGECEESSEYHALPQYGITEVDPDTKEIIGTGFLNYLTPFIRYRTTDVASEISHSCNHCEREYYPIFKNIEGRIGDFIITSKGLITLGNLIHPFRTLKNIKNSQIIQESEKNVIIRVLPWDAKSSQYKNELTLLKKDLQNILGKEMLIEIQEVEEFDKTKNGKYKWIISNISHEIIEDI